MTQPDAEQVIAQGESVAAPPPPRTATPEPWTGSALWPTFMRRTLPVETVLPESRIASVRRLAKEDSPAVEPH